MNIHLVMGICEGLDQCLEEALDEYLLCLLYTSDAADEERLV